MAEIKQLKEQHGELCELIRVLTVLMENESVRTTRPVFELLERLSEKLKQHFILEDRILYPDLLEHEDNKIRNTARGFLGGTKVIDEFFSRYRKHWRRHQAIIDDYDSFLRESKELFAFLEKRIEAEENKFFPLIEK